MIRANCIGRMVPSDPESTSIRVLLLPAGPKMRTERKGRGKCFPSVCVDQGVLVDRDQGRSSRS